VVDDRRRQAELMRPATIEYLTCALDPRLGSGRGAAQQSIRHLTAQTGPLRMGGTGGAAASTAVAAAL
jgi:hypothetical protein